MNKYNFERTGFEVNRGGRVARTGCGCDSHAHSHDHQHRVNEHKISGSYGETLNRRASESCSDGCGTGMKSRYGLSGLPHGSVYAPLQDFDCLYDHERALKRGTLFSTLDLPLEVGGGGRCNG